MQRTKNNIKREQNRHIYRLPFDGLCSCGGVKSSPLSRSSKVDYQQEIATCEVAI